MYLSYFEEQAYERLKQNIAQNIENYTTSNTDWLNAYFGETPYFSTSSRVMTSSVSLSYEEGKKLTDDEKNSNDLANVRMLYGTFKNLTPLQATNKFMWSYLAHVTFKDYVVSRWIKDSREIQKTINEKFFVNGTSGLMTDNAISRLWWAGYLTYDENNADPYHLTKILLSAQTIWTDILDTPFCGNKKVIKGILSGLKKCQDEKRITVDFMRECVKYFRRYAAVTNVDFLDEAEITDIVYEFLTKA